MLSPEIDYLLKEINQLDLFSNKLNRYRFDLTSASLRNYLPDLKFDDHIRIFREVLFYQKLSIIDQSNLDVLSKLQAINFEKYFPSNITISKAIFCTFHTGSYRAINHFLAYKNVKFTLVMSYTSASAQKDVFSSLYSSLYSNSSTDQFEILYAEEPSSFFKMIKVLKNGGNLLFYLDGNTGVNESLKNGCEINFLAQKILARSGIAYLSYLTNSTIFPVISFRENISEVFLKFEEPVFVRNSVSRSEYVLWATKRLYELIEPVVQKYPGQWEGWLYLHKSAMLHFGSSDSTILNDYDTSNLNCSYMFNDIEYSLFDDGYKYYIFKKVGYIYYEITAEVYFSLKNISEKKESDSLYCNLLSDFIKTNVIIPT